MHSSRPRPSGSSNNFAAYHDVFVRHVHQLIQLGYGRLIPADYVQTPEPAITGDLVEAIDGVLSDRAEAWMIVYSVHDDPPVNDGRRKGKQRKRVDLRIDSASVCPRARFRFEAKRLGSGNPVNLYLGPEGLGCFLCGDYARDEDHAGMLGYVQSGELTSWSDKIAGRLGDADTEYEVDPSLPFAPVSFSFGSSLQGYRSKHIRKTVGRTIVIDHVLLRFQ